MAGKKRERIRFDKVPIEEAKQMKKKIPRVAKLVEEYKGYITALSPKEAGRIEIRDDEDGKEAFKIRARIKRAGDALRLKVVIRKRGKEIYFWKEEDELKSDK